MSRQRLLLVRQKTNQQGHGGLHGFHEVVMILLAVLVESRVDHAQCAPFVSLKHFWFRCRCLDLPRLSQKSSTISDEIDVMIRASE